MKEAVVRKIIDIRLKNNRTSEVVHQELLNQGIKVSLNSVRRTIDRHGLMKKRSLWKRFHPHVAQREANFKFKMLQSDHGPEFGRWFVTQVKKSHRYTRIGKPNDNAHIERFNRTIQEECLDRLPKSVPILNENIKKYLKYSQEIGAIDK